MSDTLRVRAVEGRCYPHPGRPGEFVGLKRAPKGAKDEDIVHEVPGGQRYVSAGAIEVPNTRAIRQAIKRGDLELDDGRSTSTTRATRTAAKDRGGKDEG